MKNRNNKKIILICALFASLAISVIYFTVRYDDYKARSANQESTDYKPPTDEEQNSGNEKKAEIVENSSNEKTGPDSSAGSDKKVDIVIVDAGQYDDTIEVRAFASNVIKDGDCTFTFTKSDNKVSRVLPAYADASTTPCVNLALNRNEFSEFGTWNVEVAYSSAGYLGSSKTTLEIK